MGRRAPPAFLLAPALRLLFATAIIYLFAAHFFGGSCTAFRPFGAARESAKLARRSQAADAFLNGLAADGFRFSGSAEPSHDVCLGILSGRERPQRYLEQMLAAVLFHLPPERHPSVRIVVFFEGQSDAGSAGSGGGNASSSLISSRASSASPGHPGVRLAASLGIETVPLPPVARNETWEARLWADGEVHDSWELYVRRARVNLTRFHTFILRECARTAPVLVYFDDDVVPGPGYIDHVLRFGRDLREADGVYALLYWANWHDWESFHTPWIVLAGLVFSAAVFLPCALRSLHSPIREPRLLRAQVGMTSDRRPRVPVDILWFKRWQTRLPHRQWLRPVRRLLAQMAPPLGSNVLETRWWRRFRLVAIVFWLLWGTGVFVAATLLMSRHSVAATAHRLFIDSGVLGSHEHVPVFQRHDTNTKSTAAVLYTAHHVPEVTKYLDEHEREEPVDVLLSQLQAEASPPRGYMVSPTLFQHIGLKSSRGDALCGQQDYTFNERWPQAGDVAEYMSEYRPDADMEPASLRPSRPNRHEM
jgi:hypothetical protein